MKKIFSILNRKLYCVILANKGPPQWSLQLFISRGLSLHWQHMKVFMKVYDTPLSPQLA